MPHISLTSSHAYADILPVYGLVAARFNSLPMQLLRQSEPGYILNHYPLVGGLFSRNAIYEPECNSMAYALFFCHQPWLIPTTTLWSRRS